MELYTPAFHGPSAVSKREILRLPKQVRERKLAELVDIATRALMLPINHWASLTSMANDYDVVQPVWRRLGEWWDVSDRLKEQLQHFCTFLDTLPLVLGVDSGIFGMLLRQDPTPLLKKYGCRNLTDYCQYYARCIRNIVKRPLKDFFYIEADVVAVKGFHYSQQKEFRQLLEEETGIAPVPVYQAVIMPPVVWADVLSYRSSTVAVSLSAFRLGFRESTLLTRPQTYAYLRVLYRMAKSAGKRVHLLGVMPKRRVLEQNGSVCDTCDTAQMCYLVLTRHTFTQVGSTRKATANRTKSNQVKLMLVGAFIAMLDELMMTTMMYRQWKE